MSSKCVACGSGVGHFASVYGTRTERRLTNKADIKHEHLVNATKTAGLSPTDKRTPSRQGVFVPGGADVKVVRKFHRKLVGEFCVRCARTDGEYKFAPRDAMVGTPVKDSGVQRESARVRPHVTKHIPQVEEDVILDVTCECCHVGKTSRTCAQCGRYICTAKGCRVVVDGFVLCTECKVVTYAVDLGAYAYRGSRQAIIHDLDCGDRGVKASIVIWAGKPIEESLLGHRQCYAVPFLHHYKASGAEVVYFEHESQQSPDATYRRDNIIEGGWLKGQHRNRKVRG